MTAFFAFLTVLLELALFTDMEKDSRCRYNEPRVSAVVYPGVTLFSAAQLQMSPGYPNFLGTKPTFGGADWLLDYVMAMWREVRSIRSTRLIGLSIAWLRRRKMFIF